MAPVHSRISSRITPVNAQPTVKNLVNFTDERAGLGRQLVNEDRAVFLQTNRGPVAMSIDGITAFTDWRAEMQRHRITAASLAAETAKNVASMMRPGLTFPEFLNDLSHALEQVRVTFKVPDNEILGFVLSVYIPWEGEHGGFWQIGDCGYGYSYTADDGTEHWVDSLNGQLAENSDDANLRAEILERELKKLGLWDAYPNIDDAILAKLAKDAWDQMHAARVAKSLREHSYDWLRSAEGLAEKSKPVHLLTHRPNRIVTVSDGWERVPRTLEEGLRDHARWQEQDPLVIGRNDDDLKAAKGYMAFDGKRNKYLDDVTFVGFDYDYTT
ncbi:MAG: hypothetical protein DI585_00425 [Pseudomonas fluorescens]|nr:MAG: hypothetical protein DI585_00425 [Pseudomonas fluorescens]